jgi:hypothetical protein
MTGKEMFKEIAICSVIAVFIFVLIVTGGYVWKSFLITMWISAFVVSAFAAGMLIWGFKALFFDKS